MRNKIDNLTLFNLLWFAIASTGSILYIPALLLIAIAGAICTFIHECSLTSSIHKNVDTQYQIKLFKRVRYNIFFTLVFIILTALDFVF